MHELLAIFLLNLLESYIADYGINFDATLYRVISKYSAD